MSKFTDKDRDDFFNFIAEKSKKVTAPVSIEELCSEFKKESGTSHSENVLITKLREIRLLLFRWNGFNTEAKVKMSFALGAPVDYSFLAKFRKDAVVEVDEHLRITKYEKKGRDGFQLSGFHDPHAPEFPNETSGKILKFLAEISKSRNSPMTDEHFLREFAESTNTSQAENYADDWYNYIKCYLHIATEYDIPTRIRMLFVSGAVVNTFFLGMLQKDAIIEVDRNCQITKYEAHDGSLTLNKYQNSWEERKVEQQDAQMAFEVKKEKKESISDDLADERVENNGINTPTAVVKPETPVEVKTNSSVTRSGRVSKKIYPTTNFFANHGDDQFFRNRRRSNSRKRSSGKPKSTVVDDDSPKNTSSNIATIGGDVSDSDNKVKVSVKKENGEDAKSAITLTPKIPVPSSRSFSFSNIDDDVEFDTPTYEDNEVAAKTSGVNAKKVAKSAESTPKIKKTPAKKSTASANSSAQNKGMIDTKTNIVASNTKNEKKDAKSFSESGSSSKIDTKENKIVATKKNEAGADDNNAARLVDSIPKIQKTPAKKSTVPAISKTENEGKSNIKKVADPIKTMSTAEINDNKGSMPAEKEKNVLEAKPDAVKITPKGDNKNKKLVCSISGSSESQKDDFIYEGGVPPLPIPIITHKTEKMEYQEKKVDRFVAYRPTVFRKSLILANYQHDNDVKLEETSKISKNESGADSAADSTVSANSTARNEEKADAKKVTEPIKILSTSKIDDNKENENGPMDKNSDSVDAKKATRSVDSIPKVQNTPAKTPTALAIHMTEHGTKATPKLENKENKTLQNEENVVKTTPKVENNKRKAAENSATTSAKIPKKSVKSEMKSEENQEIEESEEDEVIYDSGIAPLPIPLLPRKTEEMEYQEEQIDDFVDYQNTPMEFGDSQLLPDYQQDNDVKVEEVDGLNAIRDASFTTVNSSLPVEYQGIEMTSSENILKMLRNLVSSMDVPMVKLCESSKKNLQEFLKKIDKALEKMRVEDHKVPTDDMMSILNVSLHIVTRSATAQSTSSEDSASLQGFLWTLRCILVNMKIPALDDFQKTINEKIQELNGQDKAVPIERIRRALETIFASATS